MLTAGLLLFAIGASASPTQYFRYQRAVASTEQRGETCIPLSADVFAHAAPGLADLRLYRGPVEVPYAIRQAAPSRTATQPVPLLNLGLRGKITVFDAAMPEGSYSDVELTIAATNFIAVVTVTGKGTKLDAHGTKLGSFTIFDLSGQKLGRSTVLHLPLSNFRFLHFEITGPLAPDQVTGISPVHLPTQQPAYLTVQSSTRVLQKDRHTVIEFDIPAHVPVDRILFTPEAQPADFSRSVAVSLAELHAQPAAEGDSPPQPVVSFGTLLRLHTVEEGKRIDEEQLAMDAPQEPGNVPSRWTVSIDNGDDAPLQLASIRLQMLERTLCFQADSGSRYTLFYGDPALHAPRYDYAMLHNTPSDAQQAEAGAEQINPEYRARPDERPYTEKHPALLWSALVGVVALLGSFALRSKPTASSR